MSKTEYTKEYILLLSGLVIIFLSILIFIGDLSVPVITGNAIATGNTTVYVNSTSSLRFVSSSVDWGTGSVNSSYTECNMTTEGGKSGCVGFNSVDGGLVLENDGNQNITVSIYSNVSGSEFIGSGGEFQWKVSENESGACPDATPSDYANVTVSVLEQTTICTALNYENPADAISVDLRVKIPLTVHTSGSGLKSATITAVGS